MSGVKIIELGVVMFDGLRRTALGVEVNMVLGVDAGDEWERGCPGVMGGRTPRGADAAWGFWSPLSLRSNSI